MSTSAVESAQSGATAGAPHAAKRFIELVRFRSRAGVTEQEVLAAAERVNVFLKSQPGFVSRRLGRSDDGTWIDILRWRSREDVTAAMEKTAASPHCAAFFGLIDPDHDEMILFEALAEFDR